MAPYRAGEKPALSAERLESETAAGARLTRGGKTSVVAFRKEGRAGRAALADVSFDANFAVR